MPIADLPVQVRYWSNFKHMPDFAGKKVLEIGCGRGGRCFQMLEQGAREVVGVDIYKPSIEIANECLKELSVEDQQKIQFVEADLHTLDIGGFDIVVSEDAFEHILHVDTTLEDIHRVLAPQGKAFIGFAPLYYSPHGDHGWMRQVLPMRKLFSWPWGHVFYPQKALFKRLSKLHGEEVNNTFEWPYMSLNQKTVEDFQEAFERSPLNINDVTVNPARSLKGKLVNAGLKIKPLRKYLIWGVYAILEK